MAAPKSAPMQIAARIRLFSFMEGILTVKVAQFDSAKDGILVVLKSFYVHDQTHWLESSVKVESVASAPRNW